jgi:glutathione S-transferase
MADYRLHCFGQSGNSYKVALFLQLAGMDWEPVYVDFFVGKQTRTDAFRSELNEMGEAPVLEHGGRRRTQSGAILQWLADTTGHFAGEGEDRYEALRWIMFDNHKFTSYFATLRFLLNFAKTGETPVTEFLRGRAQAANAIVERRLSASPFLVGAEPTIADLSLAGYVFYDEPTGIDWSEYKAISAWKERIAALPNWKGPYDLMPGPRVPV